MNDSLTHARGHEIAVLFSERSRAAYVAQAVARGETYAFTAASGDATTWLKGEYAYLAPNAASLLLSRCNLKHDVLDEAELTPDVLARLTVLLVPNAGHLGDTTVERLQRWLQASGNRLIATGKTNLPPALLGCATIEPVLLAGYGGWRWLPGSPFAGDDWEPAYVSSYDRHVAHRVEALADSRVLADLLDFTGDLRNAGTATARRIGPAIVATERTLYVSNQVFELIGGMLQAHLNVEPVRHWAHPTHWGDTLLFFLRGLLHELGLERLWQTRLRSFGTHDGVLSFRHDVHGMADYTMLDYQLQNLIPASYDIEDPAFSTNITAPMAVEWVRRTTRNDFIEPALHNDSSIGEPPTAIFGRGLFDHVVDAEKHLGFTICTCGRHAGGHMHPETLDAMDYLYAHHASVIGMCTFCYYHMIEYGVRNPEVVVQGPAGRSEVTYITDLRHTIATQGIWFPFRAVITTTREWRPLRGWDRTHEFDADYDLVETVFGAHHSRRRTPDDRLENGVYSFQYHPELARDPSLNDGKGTLDFLRYCINLAERRNFWIATQRDLYQRMMDYEALVLEPGAQPDEVIVRNPSARSIAAMVLERRAPFGSVWQGEDELVHVVKNRFVTLPPLAPGAVLTLRFSPEVRDRPLVRQPAHKGLVMVDARIVPTADETRLRLRVCRAQQLAVEGVEPATPYWVQVDDAAPCYMLPRTVRTIQALLSNDSGDPAAAPPRLRTKLPGITTFLDVALAGDADNFVERHVRIRRLQGALAVDVRDRILAGTPAKTGRVTPSSVTIPAEPLS